MSAHPGVTGAVIDHTVFAGDTRKISSNSVFHEELEIEIVALNKKEAALIFNSFYNDTACSAWTSSGLAAVRDLL